MTAPTSVSEALLAARDVRLGGRWSPRQRLKNDLIAWAIRRSLSLLDRLSPQALTRLGRIVGRAAYAWPRLRRLSLENAARCLDAAAAPFVARAAFENAGQNLARCLLLRRAETRALDHVEVSPEALGAFRRALDQGRGVVFVSAHLGPFELLPAAIAELGIAPTIVVRESYDPRLDAVVDAHRAARGIEIIHRGKPGAAARIVRALRAGRPVGFLPDLGARVPSLRVPFLGLAADLPIGPQRLALRLGCPLVVGALVRSRRTDGFALTLQTIDTMGNEEQITHRVALALTATIRAAPEHWLWMARRFA